MRPRNVFENIFFFNFGMKLDVLFLWYFKLRILFDQNLKFDISKVYSIGEKIKFKTSYRMPSHETGGY